jgi:capsid assembly protease
MKAFEAIDSALWAIDQEWLLRLRAIALGEGEGPEAVAARLGRPLQNAQRGSIRGGVATIPINGPIFRYANLFTETSGSTSIEIFARDLRAALDDPAIDAVLFDINSPGGQVDGINEAAAMIAGAEKPTAAYIGGAATSAAYWLASAADQIIVDKTARLGGIGVVTAVNRDRKAAEGIIEVVSSQSPLKRASIDTPEGRASVQGQVDKIADVFIEAVAAYRAVDRERVIEDFGQGSVKIGEGAVAAGMADTVGSYESTLREMIAEAAQRKQRGVMMPKANEPSGGVTVAGTVYTQAEFDAAVKSAALDAREKAFEEGRAGGLEAGKADGIKSERERITAIEKIALPGHEALAEQAKLDGMSAADFSMNQAETEKENRAKRLEALRNDGRAAVVANPASETGLPAAIPDSSRPLADRLKAEWDHDPKLRAEFLDNFATFEAFRINDEAGRIKILRRA